MIEDVLAVQTGAGDPGRVIVISAHIDSRVTDPLNAVADAPGADDDGSGVVAVLEAARILSREKLPATIVYAVLSGEEQGLFGGTLLAETAKAQGWRIEAVLNNDIIGNTHGGDGRVEDHVVRVFSEGVRAVETALEAADRRRSGGEADSPSRALARDLAKICATSVKGLTVRLVFRADRFGRGGDQGPMQAAGYPAVRITEGDENYARQHQDVRVEKGVAYGDVVAGVDFPYLARVTGLNVAAAAALASAPAPPENLKISGAVTADTTLSWSPSKGAAAYMVAWRETTSPDWTFFKHAGASETITLKGVNIDDYDFGVAAVSQAGYASPVEFPGPVGAFVRQAPPPPRP
jgi:Zn-dependent M28 family amino/carboxypeptidase